MKVMTISVYLLFAGVLISCNGSKKSARNNQANELSAAKPPKKESQCQNKPDELDYKTELSEEDDARISNLIDAYDYENRYNQNYIHRQRDADFRGSSGSGTGSSYASTYYGSNAKKQELIACSNDTALINANKRKLTPQSPVLGVQDYSSDTTYSEDSFGWDTPADEETYEEYNFQDSTSSEGWY